MTLASEDGSRSLKKPYVQGEVVSLPNSRWRMCLLSWSFLLSSVFFVLLLSDNFGPSRSIAMTTSISTTTSSSPSSSAASTSSATTVVVATTTTTSTSTTKSNAMLGPLIRAVVVDVAAADASTTSGSSTSDTAVHIPHNPWIPSDYLENFTINSVNHSSTCLHRTGSAGVVIVSGREFGSRSGNCSSSSTASGVEGNNNKNNNNNNNNDQCLDDHDDYYKLSNVSEFAVTAEKLQQQQQHGASAVHSLCEEGSAERARLLRRSRLGFCDRFTLARVLGEPVLQQLARANSTECSEALDRLKVLDEQAQSIFCQFDEILTRYDCRQNYSVRWSCNDCTGAYKAWVCSMLIPFHEGANHVKPCRDVCHTVEKKCPYFLPDSRLQYAGEPTFLCIDQDIPETETVSPNSSYGASHNCYRRCHQDADFHHRPPHSELNLQLHPIHRDHSVRTPVQDCPSLSPATTTSDNSTSSNASSAASSTWRTESAASNAFSAATTTTTTTNPVTSSSSSPSRHYGGRGRHTFTTHHPYPYVVTLLTLGILRLSRTFLTPPPFCLGLT